MSIKQQILETIKKRPLIIDGAMGTQLQQRDKDIPLEELGKWITAKTDGKYSLVKNSNMRPPSLLDEIKHK